MGWLRHAIGRLRGDLVAANAPLPGSEGCSTASTPLRDGEDGAATAPSPRRARLTRFQSALSCGLLRRSYTALRLADAAVYGLLAAVSLLNMLIAMSFNPGLFAAVVIGEVLGVLTLEPVGGLVRGESLSAADAAGRGCH